MIDYQTYCQIKDYHENRHLNATQIARELNLHERTVAKWLSMGRFQPQQVAPRPSKLDAYKGMLVRWLETHPYTATQIFLRLREQGYTGGITIVKDYVHHVRPSRAPAFLTLAFAPGECAQVDWGQFGSIAVGNTQRRLSFFMMVLCYSRLLYVEFTLSETMEHFLACHQHAFESFGGRVPAKIMVDNLKSAVLQRVIGEDPVFNPRYQDFAAHYGFKIKPCGVGQAHEKGRVENAVGYVKKNFLSGREFTDFSQVNPAVQAWLETVANLRCHGTTKTPPRELFQKEKPSLQPLPIKPYDIGVIQQVRANNQFRVLLDTNTYSVPAEYASTALTLKSYPDHLCVYHQDKLIARHPRRYDRHQDIEDPDHPRALLQQRRKAHEQKLLMRLLALTPKAEAFYRELQQRRLNVNEHIRKIVALSEIYGIDKTARAITDALEFQAFSCEYIANLLEQRTRLMPEPSALHLTRRGDLLDLELPEPDLTLYGGVAAGSGSIQGEPHASEQEHATPTQ
jgi:transposase